MVEYTPKRTRAPLAEEDDIVPVRVKGHGSNKGKLRK